MAHWDRLFQKYEASHAGNPEQIHDAAEEQEAHQEPAATQAISAVLEPHAEGTETSRPPLLRKKAQRRAAVAQADALEWGQLPQAGRNQDGAAEPVVRRGHHRAQ